MQLLSWVTIWSVLTKWCCWWALIGWVIGPSGYSRAGNWIVLITVMTLIAFNRHLNSKSEEILLFLKAFPVLLAFCHEKPLKCPFWLLLNICKSASLAFWILERSWLSAMENLLSVDSLKQLFGGETSQQFFKNKQKCASKTSGWGSYAFLNGVALETVSLRNQQIPSIHRESASWAPWSLK